MIAAVRTLAVVLLATTAAINVAAVPQNDRVIYVSAMGANGMPVMDLTATDFAVTEDNVAREVAAVSKATEPIYYSVLVDNSLTTQGSDGSNANNLLPYLREALSGFVKVVLTAAPDSKIQVIFMGGAAVVKQDFTSDLALLDPLVSKLVNVSSEPVVGEALTEASKQLSKVPSRRRVILVVNREPTIEGGETQSKLVAADVQKSGASVWAMSVRYGTRQDTNREALLKGLAANSGGIRLTLGSPLQLADYLRSVAANTIVQYAVTIKRPADAPPITKDSRTSVRISRPGVTPLTLQWSDK